jgi:hypothetical protein
LDERRRDAAVRLTFDGIEEIDPLWKRSAVNAADAGRRAFINMLNRLFSEHHRVSASGLSDMNVL